jgi:multiple sugar transport system permease protein
MSLNRYIRINLQPVYQYLNDNIRPELLYASPATSILLLFAAGPVLGVIALSLTSFNLAQSTIPSVIGLNNFINEVITNSLFHNAVIVTSKFIFVAVLLQFLLGFGIALLLKGRIRTRQIFLPVIITPMFITNVAVGLMFRFILDPQTGFVSYLLGYFGIGSISWFTDPQLALAAVILADVWQFTPYMTLLLLAGLESIPQSPIEAAKTDGASPVEVFIDIILPLMKPVILAALVIRTLDASKVFGKVYTMTDGGPGTSTETLSYYIYQVGFRDFELGVASAQATSILLMIIGFGVVRLIAQRRVSDI